MNAKQARKQTTKISPLILDHIKYAAKNGKTSTRLDFEIELSQLLALQKAGYSLSQEKVTFVSTYSGNERVVLCTRVSW